MPPTFSPSLHSVRAESSTEAESEASEQRINLPAQQKNGEEGLWHFWPGLGLLCSLSQQETVLHKTRRHVGSCDRIVRALSLSSPALRDLMLSACWVTYLTPGEPSRTCPLPSLFSVQTSASFH
ncbi:hypothetical protein BaRGS_00025853 [Batillaria attramentaria]|uniref:Uncharacterized protein n=1 Tax=Batillaria attramentaria TaxID=370345 RepID=A0ABD0K7L1_9CAEN